MQYVKSLTLVISGVLAGCGPKAPIDDEEDGGGSEADPSATGGPSSGSPITSPTGEWPTSYDGPTSYDDGSCENVFGTRLEVPVSVIAEWIDDDGVIAPDFCGAACFAASDGLYDFNEADVLLCGLEAIVEGEMGDGEDSSNGTTDKGSGEDTVGDTTGKGSGDDTTGAETTETTGGTDPEAIAILYCEWIGSYQCGTSGRRHVVVQTHGRVRTDDVIGCWAAYQAHAEAASVGAFLALHHELAAYGAPAALLERMLEAARDEVAHARAMTRIAARHGVPVTTPRFDRVAVRDLEAIAIENAIEGCVNETWSALEAAYQAREAADPELRATMHRIAVDETRHAELAHELAAWLAEQLDDAARRRVQDARDVAAERLLDRLGRERPPALHRAAGLPDPAMARRLGEGLRAAVWA